MKKCISLKKKLSTHANIRWVRVFLMVLLVAIGVGAGILVGIKKNSKTNSGVTKTLPTNIYEVDLWHPSRGLTTQQSAVQTIGVVEPTQAIILLAEKSGTIARIHATEGLVVKEGDVIFTLNNSDESLALAGARESASQARIALSKAQAEFESAGGTNTFALKNQQDSQVEAAYQSLLSTDLKAYASDPLNLRAGSPPVISGTYTGGSEGEYKIVAYSSASQSGASFLFEGLESGIQTISASGSVPLGTQGLFISFSGDIKTDVEWVVSIPNKRSPQYTTLTNGLKTTQAGKILQQETNEIETEDIIALQSRVRQASLFVNAAQLDYGRTIIKAPFSGVVTSISINKGDRINAQTPLGSLKNTASLEVEIEISKAAAQALVIGDQILKDGKTIASIRYVSPDVTPAGTVRVVGQLYEDQQEVFKIGQRLSVVVAPTGQAQASIQDAFTIPVTALIMRGQEAFVLLIDRFSQTTIVPVFVNRVNGQWVTLSQPVTGSIVKDARGIPDGALVQTTIVPTNRALLPQDNTSILPVILDNQNQT